MAMRLVWLAENRMRRSWGVEGVDWYMRVWKGSTLAGWLSHYQTPRSEAKAAGRWEREQREQ